MRNGLILLVVAVVTTMALPVVAQQAPERLLSQGRVDEAIRVLNAQIQSTPNDAGAYNLLERAYFGLRRWDDAQAAGERAVALAPNNSDYHLWLGRTYGEKADQVGGLSAAFLARKARQEFERAVALDASNLDARTDLAEFYVEAPSFLGGGKDKALQQAQTIATRDQATAHWVSARIAEKEKKYDLAEQEYKASIQASHDDKANFWLNLASFYKRRGRLNDMEDAISQAIVANRRKPNVLLDAATLLFRAGRNFPAAIDAIRRYLSNTVEDGPAYEAHYVLGAILEKQGDKQAAAAEYRAALSLASEFGLAQAALRRLGQ